MRNLKRALSLALAAIMVLGLMVVGASAASTYDNFTDKDEIVNQEAVNTMVSLGVLAGKDDGSYYDPTGIVTRGEMAKIIAVCLNGGKDPVLGDSTNIPKFSDVPATHWAYNYIAYCVQQNIIAGRGDGTFAPDTAVTGSEAAKMFLCALGYRADLEGLVGNEWELNTNVLANQDADLYDGLEGINPSQGLSRDNTAQMAYNAVQAQEVTYNNLFGDYTGVLQTFDKGTMLNNRFGVSKVEGVVVANDIMAIDDGTSTTVAGKSRLTDIYVDGNHRVNDAGHLIDDIYPVALDNSYLGQRVVLYVKGLKDLAPNAASTQVISEPILSADNTVATTTSRMGDADKVRSFLADNSLTLGANGVDCDATHGTVSYTDNDTVVNGSRVTREFAVTSQLNVNGTEYTFIDHDGDSVVDYIFRTLPKMAKVTVYNETDKELTIAGEGSIDFSDIANPEDVAKDDIVLYYIMNDTYYLSVAETVSGKVTTFNNENKTLTMDGTSYGQSTVQVEVSSTDLTHLTVATGGDDGMDFVDNTYTFYLDNSGNVVAWVLGDESLGNYALLLGTDVSNANAGFESAKVKLLLADGTTGTYDVNLLASANRFDLSGSTSEKETEMAAMLDYTAGNTTAGTDTATGLDNTIVSYAIGENGTVTIGNPALAGNYAATEGGDNTSKVTRSTGGYTMTLDAVAGTTDTIKVNDSTLFFIRNVSEGANDTYSVVQGVSNLPTKNIVLESDGTGDATAESAIYTTTDANNLVAKAVFVDGYFKGTANYVYVTGSYTGSTTVNGERVYSYPVVFEDGEAGTLNISDDTVAKKMVYEYTVDSNGVADVELTESTINNVVSTYSRGSNLTLANGDGSAWNVDRDGDGTLDYDFNGDGNVDYGPAFTIAYGAQLWNVENDPYPETLTDSMSMAVVLDGDGFVKTVFVNDTNVTETTTFGFSGVTGLNFLNPAKVYSGFSAVVLGGTAGDTINYTVTYDNGKTSTGTATFKTNTAVTPARAEATISVPDNADSIVVTYWSANPGPSSAAPTISAATAGTPSHDLGGVVGTVTAAGSGALTYQWYQSTDAVNNTPANDTKLVEGTNFTGVTSSTLSVNANYLSDGTPYYFYCVVTNTEDGKSGTTATTAVLTVTPAAPTQDNPLDVYSTAEEINAELDAAKAKGVTVVTLTGNSTPDARIDIPAGMTLKVTGDFTDEKGVRFEGTGSKLLVDGQYIFGSTNVGSIGNVEAGSVKLNKNATVNGELTTGAITSAASETLTVATGATLTADSVAKALNVSGTATVTGNVNDALTVDAGTATVGTVTGKIDVKTGATLNLTENTTFAASSSIAGTATVAEGKTATVSSALTVTGTLTVDTLTASNDITGTGKLVVGTFSDAATSAGHAKTTTVQVTKAATAATLEAILATDGHTLIIDVKSSDTTTNNAANNAEFFETPGDASTAGTPALDSDYIKAGTYHAATNNVYTDTSGTQDTAWLMETVAP